MKTKSFDEYLLKRLDAEEIKIIETQAAREKEIMVALQQEVATALESYMQAERIGFNELVKRLDISPSKLSKIKKGQANLTLASIAHLFALLQKQPHFVVT